MFDTVWRALNPATLSDLFALIVISLIVAAIVLAAVTLSGAAARQIWRQLSVLLFALALFGGVAGFAGGISREAAVGQIIPAVLALAGGLSAYLFGIDVSRGAIASISLIVFTITLFVGYSFGSDIRSVNDHNDAIRTACLGLFYSPDTYANQTTRDLAFDKGDARYQDCLPYLG